MLKRCRFAFFFFLFVALTAGFTKALYAETSKNIGISQIVEHPALEAVRHGLLAALKEKGFVENKNLSVHYQNAQGNLVIATQIANQLLTRNPDVLVGISTPSAQTLYASAKRNQKQIPIVFTAVSDPALAKLEPGADNYPITGITDKPNLTVLVDVMKSMLPHLKAMGVIYNPAEANSVASVQALKALLKKEGIALQAVTINSTNDIPQSLQSILGKIDALYFPQDNTVVSGIESIIHLAQHTRTQYTPELPLFCNDPLLVKKGILAAIGYNYFELGKETGYVIAELLQGKAIKDLPTHAPQKFEIVINKRLFTAFKLQPPKTPKAKIVFEEN